MSRTASPSTGRTYGLKRLCKAWDLCRASFYNRRIREQNENQFQGKRGPKPKIEDQELLDLIKNDLSDSPFKGEGHRKVHARIKRKNVAVGRNRVLKIMRGNSLLSPHRVKQSSKNPHDGKITTDAPNIMWCTDGTKIFTAKDGWVWIFSVEEHWNAECLGWHVCKVGDRFAALEPVTQAVRQTFGSISKGVADGVYLRIDNGSQYTSDYFLKQIAHMGLQGSFGLVKQPQTNGVVERFNRTLKEQVLYGKIFNTVDDVREAVGWFVEQYNAKWILGKLGYQSPLEARDAFEKMKRAA